MDDSQRTIRKNIRLFFIVSVTYTLGCSLVGEGYVQSFLMRLGLSDMDIGVYGTCVQLAALLGYGLFLFFHPKRRAGYVRAIFFLGLGGAALPAALIGAGGFGLPAWILFAGAAVFNLAMAMRAACEYCAVPMLYPRDRYGRISAKCGMAGSGLAALVSAVGASLVSGSDPMRQYLTLFALALFTLTASALIAWGYTPLPELDGEEEKAAPRARSALRRLIYLLLPHLLRGVAAAFFYYFVPVSLRKVTLSPFGQTLLVTVGVASTMAACWAFMKLQDRFRTGRLILWSNIATALFATATCLNASEPGFFLLYALYMFAFNVTAYAVPVGVLYSTPSAELPRISSLRLLIMSGASCAMYTPVASLLSAAPAWAVMAAGGLVHILSGALFCRQYTDALKNPEARG